MHTKIKFLLLMYFIVQLSCTTKQSITEYKINPILQSKLKLLAQPEQRVKLNFCDEIQFKWEEIIILPPYSNAQTLSKENLSNFKDIVSMFPELTLDEAKCVLLFVEKNKIIKFSYVLRSILDFNDLVGNQKSILKIAKKKACEDLYITKKENKTILSY